MADGLQGSDARTALRVSLEIFDAWSGLVKPTRDMYEGAMHLGAPADALDRLDGATRDVQRLRATAEEMLAFLSRARSAIEPATLEQARQALAEGRFKGPDAMRAKLCRG